MKSPKLFAQEQLTNPVIGNWGQPATADTGTLFFSFALRMWRTGITVGAFVVIIFFVWGALEWLLSGSDSKGAENGRKRITNAIIGLVLMVLSFSIVAMLNQILFEGEFDILQITIPGTETSTSTE